jgi:hypothetical protein
LQLSRTGRNEISRAILVTKGVTTDADRIFPSRYGTWDTLEDDRFAENGATEDVADLRGMKKLDAYMGNDWRAIGWEHGM